MCARQTRAIEFSYESHKSIEDNTLYIAGFIAYTKVKQLALFNVEKRVASPVN